MADDIEALVRGLKRERDTWMEVAEQYRAAFELQTARLEEFSDILIATQSELENERMDHRRRKVRSDSTLREPTPEVDQFDGHHDLDHGKNEHSFGTVTIFKPIPKSASQRPSTCFSRIERFVGQFEYGTALVEVDHLLRGPLIPDNRIQALLLKSDILRRSELIYEALAACSEALELCDRLKELQSYLPKIQYQRGVCYYQLRMAKQARDALSKVSSEDGSLYAKAAELRDSCEDQLNTNRRSGFESHRVPTKSVLAELKDDSLDVVPPKRRRTSSQFLLHVHKAKRLSLPPRWVTPRSKSCGFN